MAVDIWFGSMHIINTSRCIRHLFPTVAIALRETAQQPPRRSPSYVNLTYTIVPEARRCNAMKCSQNAS
jgi:hypothetical protein